RDNMGIAQHFQPALWKLPPQRRQGRKGQDEVADRTASNHQDLAAKRSHIRGQNLVSPSPATSNPNASRRPHPTLIRFSFAVPHSSKSRRRQGETVNQMPPRTI